MATRTIIPRDLIGLPQAAKLANVDDSTVRRWIDEGKVRGFRLAGYTIRVSRADLEALFVPMVPRN
jgi:excisionase family DNA binding protein